MAFKSSFIRLVPSRQGVHCPHDSWAKKDMACRVTSTMSRVSSKAMMPSQLSQREIAGELYVSLNTVKTHCKAIYRKLGVDGRKAAVQAARDHGLL